jgi:hypothetical protein
MSQAMYVLIPAFLLVGFAHQEIVLYIGLALFAFGKE